MRTRKNKQAQMGRAQMGTPTKTKGLFSPFAYSDHDPAGSLVVVNTKQPSIG
jgi:hypothetical protein